MNPRLRDTSGGPSLPNCSTNVVVLAGARR